MRKLLFALFVLCGSMAAQTFDAYGGLNSTGCTNATGKFTTAKVGGRWYFCTPAGHVLWLQGVQVVQQGDNSNDYQGDNLQHRLTVKYGGSGTPPTWRKLWAQAQADRLKGWNFNALGEYPDGEIRPTQTAVEYWGDTVISTLLPYIVEVRPGLSSVNQLSGYGSGFTKGFSTGIKRNVANMSTTSSLFPSFTEGADPFDPNFTSHLTAYFTSGNDAMGGALSIQMTGANKAYILGIMFDDSDNMGMTRCGVDYQDVRLGQLQGAPPTGNCAVHFGYLASIASPVQAVGDPNSDALLGTYGNQPPYSDPKFYAKYEFATWLQGTTDNGPGYASIAALNTAWGSSYTSFGTSATTTSAAACATGNGGAGPYTCTLGAGVDPDSLQIFVNGGIKGGDSGRGATGRSSIDFAPIDTSAIIGTGVSSGTLTYSTGAVSVTFNSTVANATPITVTYRKGGWGTGTGLLDEDGSHAWMPTNAYTLAGANTALKTDLDNFLYHLAKTYWSTAKADFNAIYPGFLYLGPTGMGTTCAPPRAPVLQAAGAVLDVISLNTLPCGVADDQSRIDFVVTNGGDKPWINWQGFLSDGDAYYDHTGSNASNTQAVVAGSFPTTQAVRATLYTQMMSQMRNAKGTSDSTYHVAGFMWWNLYDQRNEHANWGLATLKDNAYNATETAVGSVTCAAPLTAYTCGGESNTLSTAPYGNFLSTVTTQNATWFGGVAPSSTTTQSNTILKGTVIVQ